jgi:hypothetical protein
MELRPDFAGLSLLLGLLWLNGAPWEKGEADLVGRSERKSKMWWFLLHAGRSFVKNLQCGTVALQWGGFIQSSEGVTS